MFKVEAQEADRRSRPVRRKWGIAHKLTVASALMIMLTLLAGGVGLWQVFIIGQAMGDTHEKEQQLAWSLEMLAAGHRLVAALDRMILTKDPLLASTEIPTSLGTFSFYMETLQESGGETGALDFLEEMQVAYSELRQAASEVDKLARQELWTEAGVVLEQEVRPANERVGLLIRRVVRQANLDVEATALRAQVVVRRAALLLAALVALTTVIALGWRQFVFRGLSLSITELRQGVARISSGDLEYKLDVRTGDEIEELGDEFNKMADELADIISGLERRVADRTHGLQMAAEVARATTSVLDPDQLLRQVVDLVRERFNLYYVGLFLLDEERRFAVLRAGTGEAGRQMMAQGHRLEVGSDSMIGQCAARAEARVALDVGEEPSRFDNPLLPETRSEMALPLRSRGRVLGAMTVQSVEEAAFDEANIAVMQTMADQVAVAIDNARLFADAETALEEMEATHRHYIGQMWSEYTSTRVVSGYEQTDAGMVSLGDEVLPEVQRAVAGHRPVVRSGHGDEREGLSPSALVVPIMLRGQPIGALGFKDAEGRRRWSAEEITLAEAIAEQLALAADNLRLLDETQRHATRERLIGEITASMRETLDMGTVLKTAVQQVRQALGLPEVVIRLGASPPSSCTTGDGRNGDESARSDGEERTA